MADLVTFRFYVDWDNDSDFSEYYEDVTDYVRDATWSVGMSQAFQLVGDEMRLTLTLINKDRRFSPENSSSPYYGEMLPRRRIKIISTYLGTDRTMYLGFIDSISTEGADGITTVISGASAKRWMQEQLITLALLENVRSDEVLEQILLRLQNPAALGDDVWILGVTGKSELGETTYLSDFSPAYSFDTGNTTFTYVADNWDSSFQGNQHVGADWSGGFFGYDAIEDVVKAEQGRFFFGRDGRAYFFNRARFQINVALDDTWDNLHKTIDYSYGESIANDIRVKAYPRKITIDQLLWELDEVVELKPGKSRTIRARYSESGSDSKVGGRNAAVDNVDKDAHISISAEFFGDRADITVTNGSSTLDGELRAIQIVGDKMTTYNAQELSASDGVSKTFYGVREMQLDCKLIDNSNYAQSIAEYLLLRHHEPIGEVHSVMWTNNDDDRISRSLETAIGDRVRIVDTQIVHDAEYFVIGERHRWDNHAGSGYQTTFFVEPASSLRVWNLGVAGFSELGETTWLGL